MRDRSPAQRPTYFAKNLIWFVGGGMTVFLCLILLGIWRSGDRLFGIASIFQWLSPSSAKPRVDVPTLVVSQLSNASELTTAVFAMEAVVPTSQERKLGSVVVGTTTLLYVAYGEVRAGVDLSQLEPEDIQLADGSMQVKLPPPQVLDSKIDVHRSEVYDYDRGFLGLGPDAAPQLQTLAQRETLDKITAAACSQGVLETANERAELTVKKLLTTAGYDSIKVKTAPPNPESCARNGGVAATATKGLSLPTPPAE